MKIFIVTVIFIFSFSSCNNTKKLSNKIIQPVLEEQPTTSIEQEVDDIYSLLSYALVFKNWQYDSIPRDKRRGYNIGALLINKDKKPVYFDLNCINSTNDATQHGEVRVITGYIAKTKCFNLAGFSIYTTLEPCVMCAGMITMTSVNRVIFGQRDVEYSKAFERLAIDTRPIGGFAPYPRRVLAQASHASFCKELDDAYQAFLATDKEKILAKFLTSEKAWSIYEKTMQTFLNYKVQHVENNGIYQDALSFYKTPIPK